MNASFGMGLSAFECLSPGVSVLISRFDANFLKSFSIAEGFKLQLRLEAYNVINHPVWQDPFDGKITSSTFGEIPRGQVGQSNLPRELQLGVKITW